MKQKMVVSNIRMPESDWLQVKSIASGAGLSINEYINKIIREDSGRKQLGVKHKKKKLDEKKFWDLPDIMKNIEYKPLELSPEDEIIYGV